MIAMLRMMTVADYFFDNLEIIWVWSEFFKAMKTFAMPPSDSNEQIEDVATAMKSNKKVIEEVLE